MEKYSGINDMPTTVMINCGSEYSEVGASQKVRVKRKNKVKLIHN